MALIWSLLRPRSRSYSVPKIRYPTLIWTLNPVRIWVLIMIHLYESSSLRWKDGRGQKDFKKDSYLYLDLNLSKNFRFRLLKFFSLKCFGISLRLFIITSIIRKLSSVIWNEIFSKSFYVNFILTKLLWSKIHKNFCRNNERRFFKSFESKHTFWVIFMSPT